MDDKLKREQDSIDRAQAALDERQASLRLLQEMTDDQKAAIELMLREDDVVASTVTKTVVGKRRELCTDPDCPDTKDGKDFASSGVKRHIRAAHPDNADELQKMVDERRAARR